MGAPDVVGISEIAARLGLSKKTVDGLVQRKGFPEGTRLAAGWVFWRADVEEWIAANRPNQAQPPA